jgi:hypothetical protein
MIFHPLKTFWVFFCSVGFLFSANSFIPSSGTYAQAESENNERPESTSENVDVFVEEAAGESVNEGIDANDAEEALPEDDGIVEPEASDLSDLEEDPLSLKELEQFLDEEQWARADEETFNLLLTAAGENSRAEGRFDIYEWSGFLNNSESCTLVKAIDDLWIQASGGSLGFSAQREVFDSSENIRSFYERISWLEEGSDNWLVSWEYDLEQKKAIYISSPDFDNAVSIEGYLPGLMEWEPQNDSYFDFRFQMIETCDL